MFQVFTMTGNNMDVTNYNDFDSAWCAIKSLAGKSMRAILCDKYTAETFAYYDGTETGDGIVHKGGF